MDEKITLRIATEADAADLLEIYTPYVTETTLTFEYTAPSIEEFRQRIHNTLQKFPYYVAIKGGHIVGYAYASTFRTRAAYNWMVETTVYIHRDCRGFGIGSLLYATLEETLKIQGILGMIACIAHPNPPSFRFHEAIGFQKVGHFYNCGYKMGQWADVVWMEKHIGNHIQNPQPVIPFPQLGEYEKECFSHF